MKIKNQFLIIVKKKKKLYYLDLKLYFFICQNKIMEINKMKE